MRPSPSSSPLIRTPSTFPSPSLQVTFPSKFARNLKRVPQSHAVRFRVFIAAASKSDISSPPVQSSPPVTDSNADSGDCVWRQSLATTESVEETIEKVVYRSRFLTLLGVLGSLVGSILCFIKGCSYVVQSFVEYFINHSKVILLLVEAIDVYLLGTVMLVFGMGLYELFVSNLGPANSTSEGEATNRSNLFGLFTLKERPKWLDIKTVNELKTKVGHVIVMLLLIGFFEKSKKAAIQSPLDLLCFATSVLLCSGCLFLLSKLSDVNV
ncbi:hypothetical protein UlMin_000222 [Ulmus minor]